MGFDASSIIEKLDYDFRPYVNASGTTPEPTNDQIAEFQFTTRAIAEKMGAIGPNDPDNQRALLGFVQELSREDMEEAWDEMNKAVAALTSGRPSAEDLRELQNKSFRHHRAYLGWLMGEIMDPEASSAVINHSPVAKNGASHTLRSVKN